MTRQIKLTVNDKPIELDYFVAGYIDHVTGGILESLHDTAPIKTLKLTIGGKEGQVKISLNNANLPVNYFVEEIVKSTYAGILKPLKGVDKDAPLTSMELDITR